MSSETLKLNSAPDVKLDTVIAEQVLNHLEEETTSMTAMLNAVRGVHQALIVLDDKSLEQSLEAEARELSSNSAIQQRRLQFQDRLASVLRIAPQDVTLRCLVAATSGSARESIERVCRSLSEMAIEMDRLNRQNAAMIGQSLSIARGVVERLTGATAVNESYNAAGARAETHVGPLIQWGG